ncbi:hypothetical protein [Nostoc phage NMeng1]|nr:hypothetical protein [Nostoc phage NMeng1]
MPITSRVAYWRRGSGPVRRKATLGRVTANRTFSLPGNCYLERIVVFNNGASNQAAITVGTGAAGTQFSSGAQVNAGNTGVFEATAVQPLRTDRNVFIESAAWQTGVFIVLEYTEYPPTDDTSGVT